MLPLARYSNKADVSANICSCSPESMLISRPLHCAALTYKGGDVVAPYALELGLIRFGGHLPKGEYDVDHDGHEGQADAAELHG